MADHIIITNTKRLNKLTEEEITNLIENYDCPIHIIFDEPFITSSVFSTLLKLNLTGKITITENKDRKTVEEILSTFFLNPFPEREYIFLLDKTYQIKIPSLEEIPKPGRKRAVKSGTKQTPQKEEKQEPDISSAPKKGRPRKETSEIKPEENMVKENSKKTRKTSGAGYDNLGLTSELLNSAAKKNPCLHKLLEDKENYERLIQVITQSSDKNIGLPILLDVSYGKETSAEILPALQEFYDRIKNN